MVSDSQLGRYSKVPVLICSVCTWSTGQHDQQAKLKQCTLLPGLGIQMANLAINAVVRRRQQNWSSVLSSLLSGKDSMKDVLFQVV